VRWTLVAPAWLNDKRKRTKNRLAVSAAEEYVRHRSDSGARSR
jgi:hypothetical protein